MRLIKFSFVVCIIVCITMACSSETKKQEDPCKNLKPGEVLVKTGTTAGVTTIQMTKVMTKKEWEESFLKPEIICEGKKK
jgi:hypothetical protein